MKIEVDDRTWAEINGYRYGGIDEAFIGRVLETHIPHPRYRSDSQTNPADVFRQVIISPYCRAQVESDFWCEVIVHGDRPGADGQATPSRCRQMANQALASLLDSHTSP